jgi:hypothetical protein
LWAEANKNKTAGLQKVQALVRGWLLRKRLHYAGPGVLCRKNLANDDDLETCETASRQDPFEYIGFEENGKVWWFDFSTLWKWCLRSGEPTNPYTKVPLTADTKKRLRAMWSYKMRHRLPRPSEPNGLSERIQGRWNIICQLFADNGFGNIDPHMFVHMGKYQYNGVFRFLRDDMQIVFPETSRTRRFVATQCNRMLYTITIIEPNIFLLNSTYVLMAMMLYPKDPYVLAFTLLSALYRA